MRPNGCLILLVLVMMVVASVAQASEVIYPSGSNYLLSDGWIYYTIRAGHPLHLYRMREDGTDVQKLTEDGSTCMTVAGDTIYGIGGEPPFTGLVRVRTDGTNQEAILDETVDCRWEHLYAVGSDLYLTGYLGRRAGIFKMSMDTAPEYQFFETQHPPSAMLFQDGWIYFVDSTTSSKYVPLDYWLYKMRTDGMERTKLLHLKEHHLELLAIRSGKLYGNLRTATGSSFQSIDLDNFTRIKVLKNKMAEGADGDWAYYQGQTGLRKVSLDGQTAMPQPGGEALAYANFIDFAIAGPWIFYKKMRVPCMMSLDGTQNTIVPGYEEIPAE